MPQGWPKKLAAPNKVCALGAWGFILTLGQSRNTHKLLTAL